MDIVVVIADNFKKPTIYYNSIILFDENTAFCFFCFVTFLSGFPVFSLDFPPLLWFFFWLIVLFSILFILLSLLQVIENCLFFAALFWKVTFKFKCNAKRLQCQQIRKFIASIFARATGLTKNYSHCWLNVVVLFINGVTDTSSSCLTRYFAIDELFSLPKRSRDQYKPWFINYFSKFFKLITGKSWLLFKLLIHCHTSINFNS